MKFYINTVNAAYAENRTGISARYDEIMEVSLAEYFQADMDGEKYVCLQWHTCKYPTKEEFLGETDV